MPSTVACLSLSINVLTPMPRILHLMETDADLQTRRCIELLSCALGEGFACATARIGRGGDWRNLPAALVGLWRRRDFDLLHAWGERPLTAAAIVGRTPVIHTPDPAPSAKSIHWLNAAMRYRPMRIICSTETMRRELVGRGVLADPCIVIRPGVGFSRLRRKKDPELRASLGVADTDYLLLAAGESTPQAAHKDALWAAGILHVHGPAYRLLIWGRGREADAVDRFNRRLIDPQLLCVAARRLGPSVQYEQLLSAADMMVVSATGSVAPLPICLGMAAGLPIVSTTTPGTAELLEDRHTALMVGGNSPKQLAQRILKLREDRQLQWKLADTARAEAYQLYSVSTFVNAHRDVYRDAIMS